jgi:kynureninase
MKNRSTVQLDKKDPLSKYANEFYKLEKTIYLDGNSLGLLSKKAERSTLDFLESWKKFGIEGWTAGDTPWFYLAEDLGTMMAPLVGAKKDEVICTGSTTINLHQLLSTFYRPSGKKVKIIADELNFPSDIYAIKSHLKLVGLNPAKDLILIKSRDGKLIDERDIINAFSDEIALVILPVVMYRSGQLLNVGNITKAAHKHNILVGFDAAHSIGAVTHHFHEQQVDFAFWCTYKYLNGGPGSVGGLYVHNKHFGQEPGLAGWFSSNKKQQFDMSLEPCYADHAGAYQIGTPHILSMSALKGSLELFEEIGIEKIRTKSLKLTDFLINLIKAELAELDVEIITPEDKKSRGGHIAISHPHAMQIAQVLRRKGVVPDFRPPNIIRLAPIAFYTSFGDIEKAIGILKSIILTKQYMEISEKRAIVS